MEFSFDTAQSQSRRSALGARSQNGSTAFSSASSSDRLQKAIERNRAKQAKRSSFSRTAPSMSAGTLGNSSTQQDITEALKARLLKKQQEVQEARGTRTLPRNSPVSNSGGEIVVMPKSRPTRKNVAVAGRASFSEPQKKAKLPAPIRYLGLGKGSSKVKKKNKKLVEHLVVFGWICMSILGFRLLLSDRGVLDYYKHKTVLENIHHDTLQLEIDNEELVQEIEKIRSSARYQKKIVRDYLGFIAQNEYLVLFAKRRSPASDTN